MARPRRLGPRMLDLRSIAEGMSTPGIDPRQWVSYGLVESEDPVEFDDELGPLVNVRLQPSNVAVRCRVAGQVAGNGEAEYSPFIAGDEVLVTMPGGSERNCVITGRLCNGLDKFPAESVAGQDPTTNSFAFKRQRTPFIHEIAGPYIVRQATTGAMFSFDAKGSLTIRNGNGDALQMTADYCTIQSSDGTSMFQLDFTNGRLTIQAGDALFTLSDSLAAPQSNAITTNGTLSLSANSQPAAEHLVTTEALANILTAFGGLILPIPVTPAQVAGAFAAAAASPLLPPVAAAIFAAFQAATQKPPGVPGQGQMMPGIGCSGLLGG